MSWALVFRNFVGPPWPLLFAVAGFGLILSIHSAGHATLSVFCGTSTAWLLFASDWPDALDMVMALNPPTRLLRDWALMLLAMMPPLLAAPLMHVWRSSLPSRRIQALGSFVLGYGSLWMTAGPILIGLALMLQLLMSDGAFVGALLLAVVWSACPWQRVALNRSHRLERIGLFGWSAGRDPLTFGATHATWCIASCWAWMLLPLAAGHWHIPVMILAGAAMLGERLTPPDRPRWRAPTVISLIDRCAVVILRQCAARHG